jgi:Cytochrome c
MLMLPDDLPLSIQRSVRGGSFALFMVTMLAAWGHPAQAEDFHLGITEYEISCMSCHGVDGRGDGPRAKTLKTAPADLTMIAKSHNGEFPARKLTEIIDGRAIVGTHGQRDMPVWGDRYRVRIGANEPNSAIDRRARAQISALVEYLRGIQEK